MELQELSDKYHSIVESLLSQYSLELKHEITFGQMESEEGVKSDAAYVVLTDGTIKLDTLTNLEDRNFSRDVESLLLQYRKLKSNAGQEITEGS